MLGLTLDLFLKLIDRCIALRKHQEQNNKQLYIDFVAPAFADFEAVHKDYIEGFRQYRDMIENSNTAFNEKHPVIQAIARDSLFSHNLRQKVYALWDLEADPLIGEFVRSVYSYMHVAVNPPFPDVKFLYDDSDDADSLDEHSISRRFNPVRVEFREGLEKAFSKEWTEQSAKRSFGLKVVDGIVARTQMEYGTVVTEHSALKRRLLKPK